MSKLGIVYTKEDLKNILDNTFYPNEQGNPNPLFSLVGLAFSENTDNAADAAARNRTSPEYEEKVFKIDAIFYQRREGFQIVSVDAPTQLRPVDHVFHSEGNARLEPLRGRNNERAEAEQNDRLEQSSYEFWNNNNGFVFFSRSQLEVILSNANQITISGARIDYGTGTKVYTEERSFLYKTTAYGTLKAESDLQGENNAVQNSDYVFDVAIGLPCPPIWADRRILDELDLSILLDQFKRHKLDLSQKNILGDLLKDRFTNQHSLLKKQWSIFALHYLSKLGYDKKYLYKIEKMV